MYGNGMKPGMPGMGMQMPQQQRPPMAPGMQGGAPMAPQGAPQAPMMPQLSREEISKMLGTMLQGGRY